MNKPEILGIEVLTPDGRGNILSLHCKRVTVRLNVIKLNQIMKGTKREEMNYSYEYEDVDIIKGQYCFNDERINYQYDVVL